MSDHVYQGIHSRVSTGTLDQPSIDISINTWWTFHFSQTQSTLNQYLDRHSLTVGRKLVKCQPVQRYRNWSTLNGMSAKISWLSTKMLIKCWSSVNHIDQVLGHPVTTRTLMDYTYVRILDTLRYLLCRVVYIPVLRVCHHHMLSHVPDSYNLQVYQ